MAENVTYSKIVELLDNSQYLAALKKAEDEEKTVTALRTAGGTAAVKALRETEKAQQQQAKEAAKAAAAEMAIQQKKAEYLERLRIQSYKDEQKAAERAERAALKAAQGPSAWTLALQANTAATQASAKELADLRGQINLGAESLGKLGGALSLVSPELATLTGGLQKVTGLFSAGASGVQLLGGALTTVAGAASAVALAVSPLILLYNDMAVAQEAAAAGQQALNDAMEAADPLYSRALSDLGKLSELRRGSMTVDERKAEIENQYAAELSASNDVLAAQIALDEEWLATNSSAKAGWQERTDNVKALNDEMRANEERSAAGAEAAKILIDYQEEEAAAARAVAEAKAREAAARQRSNESRREEEAAIKEALAYLAKEEEAERKYFENMGAAQAAKDRATEAARVKQLADYNAMLKAMGEADAKALDEQEDRYNAAMKRREQATIDTAVTVLDATANASADIAEVIGQQNAEAGEKAWKVSQTLALLQATAAAIEGGAKAAAGAAPLGPIAAGVAGAATFALIEGAYVAKLSAMETPTFSDTPAGGYRMGPEGQTVRGAANDTAILFRDPLEGFAQAVEVMARRQAPTSSPKRGGRSLLGVSAATTPVSRLLTRDVERATRGKL